MRRTLLVIWDGDQPRDLRRIGTTGQSVAIEKFVSTEQQLLGDQSLRQHRGIAVRRTASLPLAYAR
jgi:hypothetical protein